MGSIAISRRVREAELAPIGQPKPLARAAFASGNRREDPLSTLACRLFWPNSILRPLIFVTFRLGDLPQELTAMQFYDLIMLAVLGLAVFFGYWKGFAWQLASLTAIIVSYMVARNFNEPVAKMIGGDPSWNRFLAMFILFTGTSLLIWLGFGFVKGTIEKLHLKGFDRQFGAILGFVKGFIICTLITLFAVSLLGESAGRMICTSVSGNYIARVLSHTGGVVPKEIEGYVSPYIDKFQKEMDEYKGDAPSGMHALDSIKGAFAGHGSDQRSGQPAAHVGQLQKIAPQNQSSQQPGYTGSWTNSGQSQAVSSSANSRGGSFQTPSIKAPQSLQGATQETVQGAAEKAIQDAWKKAWGGNGK